MKFDFAIVYHEIIDDETLNTYDLAIYTVLCKFANLKTGECFPKQSKIAKKAGCSTGKVSESLKKLKEKGYINIRKKWKKNYYTINYIKNRKIRKK